MALGRLPLARASLAELEALVVQHEVLRGHDDAHGGALVFEIGVLAPGDCSLLVLLGRRLVEVAHLAGQVEPLEHPLRERVHLLGRLGALAVLWPFILGDVVVEAAATAAAAATEPRADRRRLPALESSPAASLEAVRASLVDDEAQLDETAVETGLA